MCPPWGMLKNPLLLLKMCHFVLRPSELGSHTSSMERQIPLRDFMADFVAMGVKDMAKKYELFGGLE